MVAGPSLCQEVWSPTTVRAFALKIVNVSIFWFSILPEDPSLTDVYHTTNIDPENDESYMIYDIFKVAGEWYRMAEIRV